MGSLIYYYIDDATKAFFRSESAFEFAAFLRRKIHIAYVPNAFCLYQKVLNDGGKGKRVALCFQHRTLASCISVLWQQLSFLFLLPQFRKKAVLR